MHSIHVDMSRGLETVPVLVYEGDASDGVPFLDKSYTYVRSPGIHATVPIAPVSAATSGSTAQSGIYDDTSTTKPNTCPCELEEGDSNYVRDGLLHPRYIVQVRTFVFQSP